MRQFDIREPSVEALKDAPVYFRYSSNKNKVLIDGLTAQALLTVYENLNSANQARFPALLSTPARLTKLVDFCWKNVKMG